MSNKQTKHYVYVVDKKGNPLPPTTRCGHVRKLLEEGKAVPISNHPFTIRLKYDVNYDHEQAFVYGQDPGRENIGEAVSGKVGAFLLLNKVPVGFLGTHRL